MEVGADSGSGCRGVCVLERGSRWLEPRVNELGLHVGPVRSEYLVAHIGFQACVGSKNGSSRNFTFRVLPKSVQEQLLVESVPSTFNYILQPAIE